MTTMTEVAASRELLANLTLRELRGKYKRTVLGWGWSLVNPVAQMLIFSVVFGALLGGSKIIAPGADGIGRNFALFLLCGLLPWLFFANGATGGMSALLANANLIKKTYFPRELLVASTVFSFDVSLLIELTVLAAAFLALGSISIPWLFATVPFVALLTVFTLGIALALAVLNVYFRDLTHIVGIGLQLWFYATPIVYPINLVQSKVGPTALMVYRLNPLERFVEAFRALLYFHRWPTGVTTLLLVGFSVLSIAIGAAVFRRFEPRLAEEL